MYRKVLQVGPKTLAVSLPSTWVKEYALTKGDELQVTVENHVLRVSTNKGVVYESGVVDASALGRMAPRIIGMLYKVGYTRIKVWYDDVEVIHHGKKMSELNMIQNVVEPFNGMQFWEIGKQKKRSYVLAIESSQISTQEFERVLDKLWLHLERQIALLSNMRFEEARMNERLINQTSDFCMKILTTKGHGGHQKTLHYHMLVDKLENLGDKAFKAAELMQQGKHPTKHFEVCTHSYTEVLALYRKFSLDKATQVSLFIEDAVQKLQEELFKKCSIMDASAYALLQGLVEIVEVLCFLHVERFRESNE